jgi:2-amino-4-hydroxy-6-hydroxymethyldihydropteridine diphosphokinase
MSAKQPSWQPAYVALGSNLDNPVAQLQEAVQRVRALDSINALRVSGFYRSSPLGGLDQPDYVNAAAGFVTQVPPFALLQQLLSIEAAMGRQRGEKWAARRIDLDLLVYGRLTTAEPGLTLPHPGIASRNFVLYPLAELAPTLEIPGVGVVAALCELVGSLGLTRLV